PDLPRKTGQIRMQVFEILPSGPIRGRVRVPGSKYQANRGLLLAALADGDSELSPVPANDDIRRVQDGIAVLGAGVRADGDRIFVRGVGGKLRGGQINVNASGTFARFVSALAGLSQEPVTIDGSARMRERPMADLCAALRSLGVTVTSNQVTDALPLTIQGPLQGGVCELPGHVSSQFLSALLLVAPYALRDVTIRLTTPLVSRPFVEMTLAMMAESGVEVESHGEEFTVRAGQRYRARRFDLEADPCSASYFLAAAALTAGEITVDAFNIESVQGEARLPLLLDQMGCLIKRTPDGLKLSGPALGLRAIDADMGNMPDVVQTVAVLAAFANGVSRFHNIGHLAHKESNRIFDTALELKKMGVKVEATADALIVEGGEPHGALIETHEDHRMAMSFAIAGLAIPGVRIAHPDVVGKSFPQYWDTLRGLGVQIVDKELTGESGG
ncbi:MAG TPA: 3-phosphoshikimate 1-carboxyvinyltransferase, partial [Permianibacter sp.]|nr:3-phosphoshikimate 1-carboxyvinyltransferase [Permianibacter sp.]